jgi:hypothetical protein
MRRCLRTILPITGVLVLTLLASLSLMAQGSAAGLGTWTADVAKSKYSPGPSPKSQTVRYEAVPNGLKRTIDTVDAKGQMTHSEVVFNYDGKEVAVPGAAQPTTLAWKRLDDRTTETVAESER